MWKSGNKHVMWIWYDTFVQLSIMMLFDPSDWAGYCYPSYEIAKKKNTSSRILLNSWHGIVMYVCLELSVILFIHFSTERNHDVIAFPALALNVIIDILIPFNLAAHALFLRVLNNTRAWPSSPLSKKINDWETELWHKGAGTWWLG